MKSAPTGGSDVNVGSGSFMQQSPHRATEHQICYMLLFASHLGASLSGCWIWIPSQDVGVNHEKVPLSGKLRIVSLQDSPQFMALSYVWGAYSSPRVVINCNGGTPIEITMNCRDALIALRKRYGAVTIWIDLICIDQKNILEKNQQIPLMEEIHTWAERVLV
jgi:hypothetical protein